MSDKKINALSRKTIFDATSESELLTELKRSESDYQNLVNSVDGIVWQADAKTFQFSFVSRSALKMGYPLQQWLDDPTFWKDHLHPDDREKAVSYCIACIRQKISHQLEYRMIARDGSVVCIHDNVSVIVEKDEPVLLRGIMTDCTERKNAEDELKKLSMVAKETINGVIIRDKDQNIIWVNSAFTKMYGYELDEVIGKNPKNFLPGPETDIKAINGAKEQFIKKEPFVFEILNYTKTGNKIYARIQVQPIFDEKGDFKQSFAMHTDITEKKRAEAELKKLSMVVKETVNGVTICDRDENIVWVNNAFTKMYGYESDEVIGKNPGRLLRGADTDMEVVKSIKEKVLKKDPFAFEILNYTKSGEKIYIKVQVQLVLDDKGDIEQFFSIETDITRQKELEEKVELEKIIKQKQITNAVFAAQESERSEIGRELHDNVNQLLSATRLYIDMARKDEPDRDLLLTSASAFALSAIEEIRKLSKTLIAPLIKEISLADSIKDLAEGVMLVHPIQILFAVKNFTEVGLSDKFKLNIFRIVQEEINNTLKHAKAKEININFEERDGKLIISITDDGIGFDTTKRKAGVGLINIKSRSELYNGTVLLTSEQGKGTALSLIFNKQDLLDDHNETGL